MVFKQQEKYHSITEGKHDMMKRVKRKLGFAALTSILTFSLAACGGKSASNETKASEQPAGTVTTDELKAEPGAELLLWDSKDPFVEYASKEFEKKYNVKVKFEKVESTDTVKRLSTDGPAGTGADIVVFPHDHLGTAVKSGVVLPNDYFEEETKETIVEPAVQASTYEDVLYGYPRNIETYALYVNKDLVKDAKLDTWEDIIAFSKQFNDVPNNKFGFLYEANNAYFNYAFMAGYGGYVFGKNGSDKNDIGINNEGAIKGMEFYRSLKEIIPVNPKDITYDVKTGLWQEGKVAINLDGIWNAGNFAKLPFKVEVIPLPKMPGGADPVAFSGVKSYYVSSYSKYPNAARLFAHFLTTKEMMLKNYELNGVLPAAKGLENEEAIKNDKIIAGFMQQVVKTQPMPSIPETQFFWQSVTPALEQIWNGADVKATLDKAAADMKTNIAAGNK